MLQNVERILTFTTMIFILRNMILIILVCIVDDSNVNWLQTNNILYFDGKTDALVWILSDYSLCTRHIWYVDFMISSPSSRQPSQHRNVLSVINRRQSGYNSKWEHDHHSCRV